MSRFFEVTEPLNIISANCCNGCSIAENRKMINLAVGRILDYFDLKNI